MAEYIERESLINALTKSNEAHASNTRESALLHRNIMIVNGHPAADVAHVRHGKWIFDGDLFGFYCTECRYDIGNIRKYKYCPNCGAKMDLEG